MCRRIVSGFGNSSVYYIRFDDRYLKCKRYEVNQEWMMTIAYYDSWQNACCRGVVKLPLLGKALLLVVLIYLVIQIKSSDIQPFIYFQF